MARVISRLGSLSGLLILGLLLLFAEGCLTPRPGPGHFQETSLPSERIAQRLLQLTRIEVEDHPQSREANLLQRFYADENGRPVWINAQGVSISAWQLVEVLDSADLEGLPPERYEPDYLRSLLKPPADDSEAFLGWTIEEVARADLAFSRVFFRYAGDNLWGQERSWRSRGEWHRARRKIDPVSLLGLALELDAIPSALRELPPHNPEYRRLREILQRYRRLADIGGWPRIAEGEILHPGEPDVRLAALLRRLQLEGDISSLVSAADVFSPELAQGLRNFQRRHGLSPDAVLGPQTLEALNVPVEERIAQIMRNMERWRWEPETEDLEVRVNLAAFSLDVIRDGKSELQMPVVIGRRTKPTPIFSSRIESMIFSPYWYVPPSLLREVKPKVAVDRSYLRRNHYEVLDAAGELVRVGGDFAQLWQRGEVDAVLRQQPGPWNPMGKVKFLTPNPWSIYLHDTPKKTLFSRTKRAYSSGCVRLSRPDALARWLLENEAWESQRIETRLKSGAPRMVRVNSPVALRIGYWTSWIDEGGRVHFLDDVYGRDQRLARELRQGLPQLSLLHL